MQLPICPFENKRADMLKLIKASLCCLLFGKYGGFRSDMAKDKFKKKSCIFKNIKIIGSQKD